MPPLLLGCTLALSVCASSASAFTPPDGRAMELVTSVDKNSASPHTAAPATTPSTIDALSTGPAEDVTPNGAKLTGSLSPDGTSAFYYFQYGTSTEYGFTSPAPPGTNSGTGGLGCEPPGGLMCGPTAAETVLGSLEVNTTYHYRLVATNTYGTTDGEDATFTTSGPPTIASESAEPVRNSSATIKAQIDSDGFNTKYHVEFGESAGYGTDLPVPDAEIGPSGEPVVVEVNLESLKPHTTYHFRVVAANEAGPPVDGPDQEFTTLPPVSIDSESPADVTATSALLQAQVNPLGSDTHYYFE
jgi:hypothetical protein